MSLCAPRFVVWYYDWSNQGLEPPFVHDNHTGENIFSKYHAWYERGVWARNRAKLLNEQYEETLSKKRQNNENNLS